MDFITGHSHENINEHYDTMRKYNRLANFSHFQDLMERLNEVIKVTQQFAQSTLPDPELCANFALSGSTLEGVSVNRIFGDQIEFDIMYMPNILKIKEEEQVLALRPAFGAPGYVWLRVLDNDIMAKLIALGDAVVYHVVEPNPTDLSRMMVSWYLSPTMTTTNEGHPFGPFHWLRPPYIKQNVDQLLQALCSDFNLSDAKIIQQEQASNTGAAYTLTLQGTETGVGPTPYSLPRILQLMGSEEMISHLAGNLDPRSTSVIQKGLQMASTMFEGLVDKPNTSDEIKENQKELKNLSLIESSGNCNENNAENSADDTGSLSAKQVTKQEPLTSEIPKSEIPLSTSSSQLPSSTASVLASMIQPEKTPETELKPEQQEEVRKSVRKSFQPIVEVFRSYQPYRPKWTAASSKGTENLESMVHQVSMDHVLAIDCDGWPYFAHEWLLRERQWPSPELVEEIRHGGFNLVPKCSKGGYRELEWRVSFSRAETTLMKNMPEIAKDVYCIVKALFYQQLLHPSVLSSYQLKNVFLWLCEKHNPELWSYDNIGKYVFSFMDAFIHCLINQSCPSYFIPLNNLMRDVTQECLREIARKLVKIRKEPLKYPSKEIQSRIKDTVFRKTLLPAEMLEVQDFELD